MLNSNKKIQSQRISQLEEEDKVLEKDEVTVEIPQNVESRKASWQYSSKSLDDAMAVESFQNDHDKTTQTE